MSVRDALSIVLNQLNTIHVQGEADISTMDSAIKNVKEIMKALDNFENGGTLD